MTWFKCKFPFIRSGATWRAACLFLVLLPISVLAATIQPYQAKVIGIADGDTITVLQNNTPIKIRLYGIDCPEKRQAFGHKAKEFASDVVFGRVVKIVPVDKDRYGRTIAWVYLESKCLNEELLRAGLAWHFKKYSSDKSLAELETEARQKKVGLWSDPKVVAPWEYRRLKRTSVLSDRKKLMISGNRFQIINMATAPAVCELQNLWRQIGTSRWLII